MHQYHRTSHHQQQQGVQGGGWSGRTPTMCHTGSSNTTVLTVVLAVRTLRHSTSVALEVRSSIMSSLLLRLATVMVRTVVLLLYYCRL